MAMVGALAFAAAFLAACGGGGGNSSVTGTYSCQAAFPGADGGAGLPAVCLDVSGGGSQEMASARQQCAAEGNMFLSEPCPHAGALGGCRETAAGATVALTTWYYDDGYSTAADIQSLCEGLAGVAPSTVMIQFVLP
jgi:hypothetical protein